MMLYIDAITYYIAEIVPSCYGILYTSCGIFYFVIHWIVRDIFNKIASWFRESQQKLWRKTYEVYLISRVRNF